MLSLEISMNSLEKEGGTAGREDKEGRGTRPGYGGSGTPVN